jgi:hypothetical protein
VRREKAAARSEFVSRAGDLAQAGFDDADTQARHQSAKAVASENRSVLQE